MLPSALYTMWHMHIQSLKLLHQKVKERKFNIQYVAQYPLHHVTYPATKFEVAMSDRLGGDAFTRIYMI